MDWLTLVVIMAVLAATLGLMIWIDKKPE